MNINRKKLLNDIKIKIKREISKKVFDKYKLNRSYCSYHTEYDLKTNENHNKQLYYCIETQKQIIDVIYKQIN